MGHLPAVYNVFGTLISSTSLEKVADVLRSRLGFSADQVRLYRSQFDGMETICINTEDFEFETQKVEKANEWRLNGAVAGDLEEMTSHVKRLSDQLRWAGYETRFELYDKDFICIAEYPTPEGAA